MGALLISPGYSSAAERFGPDASFQRESILADFDQLNLTQVIAGDANVPFKLGTTNFDAGQSTIAINFMLGYGITDRWTIAAQLPLQFSKYRVDAWLTPDPNQFNLRVTGEQFECPTGDFDLLNDFDKLGEQLDGYQFSVADVDRALKSPCLGYRSPFDSVELDSSDGLVHGRAERNFSGFRDLALATKYKFYHTESLGLAGLLYAVLPTGAIDDPNDFFDPKFGDGQADIGLLVAATVPWWKFRFSISTGYEVSLPDEEVLRLWNLNFSEDLETQLAEGRITEAQLIDQHLDSGSTIPIVPAYDLTLVNRKLGDTFYIYSGVIFEINEWLFAGVTIDYLYHFRDSISTRGRVADDSQYFTEAQIREQVAAEVQSGALSEDDRIPELKARLSNSKGRKEGAYAWHTVRQHLVGGVGLTFTTLPWFLKDEFPIPLIMSLSGQYWLYGQNIDVADAVSLTIGVPFAFGEVKDPAEYGFDNIEGQGLPWP